MTKVGVGIVTYNSPRRFEQCWPTVWEQLSSFCDIVAYEDGSPQPARREYEAIAGRVPFYLEVSDGTNRGVAHAKNKVLQTLLEGDCDYFFTCEDDMTVVDPRAVTEYIRWSELVGIEHFNFAHHGTMNVAGPTDVEPSGLEIYSACVGSWSFFTRRALETVGLFDEQFVNACEHLDHTYRLAQAGFAHPFWRFADVPGSKDWIVPQADEARTSHNHGRSHDQWFSNLIANKARWNIKHPELQL